MFFYLKADIGALIEYKYENTECFVLCNQNGNIEFMSPGTDMQNHKILFSTFNYQSTEPVGNQARQNCHLIDILEADDFCL